MDKIAEIQTLTAIIDHGSLTAAAERLGVTRSAVSQTLKGLEERLGVRLIQRTTRRLAPTEEGRDFYERGKRLLGDLDDAEEAITRQARSARGLLRVGAPMSFGVRHLTRALPGFMRRHPALSVQLVLNDRTVDPVEDGVDVALRIGALADSSLVGRRIVAVKRVLCAAPSYLARRGVPAHPRDLARHDCLHYGYLSSGTIWRLEGPDGAHGIPIAARLCANNGDVLADAARDGLGIALLPTFIAGAALQAGELAVVLPDYRPPEAWLHALHPPQRHVPARVRLYIDHLVETFGGRPYWDLVE
jgi:DNA-binding transcriptional LysR family regulator